MRPPATRDALHALSHTRTPSAGRASNAYAKAPRPHTPNASHTTQLSAHLCTHTCICSAPHTHDAVCAGNTCRAYTRHALLARTRGSTPAAAQRRSCGSNVSNLQLRACNMQQHNHHSNQRRTRMLNATLAQQRLHQRSDRNQIHQRLRSCQRGSSSRPAAQQWQQRSSYQQQCTPHPRHAHAHTHASPRCHPHTRRAL